jgi:hypothetical protein
MGMDVHAIYAVRKDNIIIPVEDFEPFISDGFRNSEFFQNTMINGVAYESNELPKVLIGRSFFIKEDWYYDVIFPKEDENWMFGIRVTNLKAWDDIFDEYCRESEKTLLSLEVYEKLLDMGVTFPADFNYDIIEDKENEAAIRISQRIIAEMLKVKYEYNIDNDEDVLFIYGFDW